MWRHWNFELLLLCWHYYRFYMSWENLYTHCFCPPQIPTWIYWDDLAVQLMVIHIESYWVCLGCYWRCSVLSQYKEKEEHWEYFHPSPQCLCWCSFSWHEAHERNSCSEAVLGCGFKALLGRLPEWAFFGGVFPAVRRMSGNAMMNPQTHIAKTLSHNHQFIPSTIDNYPVDRM